jgi:hypothetical protein
MNQLDGTGKEWSSSGAERNGADCRERLEGLKRERGEHRGEERHAGSATRDPTTNPY